MRGLKIFLLCLPVCVAAGSRSVWDGAYTKEQSARGKTAYLEVCAKCHGETLSGGESAPALAGKDFLKTWNGRTAGDLLGLIIKTMPTDDPGSMSHRQYADIAAYVLNQNEFPAGAKDLDSSPAASQDIRIEEKK